MEWIDLPLLSRFAEITCRTFTRKGGVSAPPFDGLNLSHGKGDEEELVNANLKSVADAMGVEKLVWTNQIHGKRIVAIDRHPEAILDCDGLTTATPGLALTIKHADCQAGIFYDPVHQVIGAAHAGWRGLVQNIYREMVRTMGELYGSRPEDLFVVVAPSLGPEASEFIHYLEEFPPSFWPFQHRPNYFDLWAIASHQLKEAGLISNQIEVVERSTYAEPDHFFSYRRDRVTGRNGTVVLLNRTAPYDFL